VKGFSASANQLAYVANQLAGVRGERALLLVTNDSVARTEPAGIMFDNP